MDRAENRRQPRPRTDDQKARSRSVGRGRMGQLRGVRAGLSCLLNRIDERCEVERFVDNCPHLRNASKLVRVGGDDDHRYLTGVLTRAQLAQYLVPRDVGERKVEKNKLGMTTSHRRY